MPPMQ